MQTRLNPDGSPKRHISKSYVIRCLDLGEYFVSFLILEGINISFRNI